MRTPPPSAPPQRGDGTRSALLQAASEVFAREGFHAVSTRELAQAAGVNQALIGYHFGGKEGLYLAVFESIVGRMREHIGREAAAVEGLVREAPGELSTRARRARYLPPLLAVCDGMLALMLSEETQQWSQLILREQQSPTAAFEVLYSGFMGRMLGLLSRLVQLLRGESDAERSRLIVVGIVGQILIWRAARAGIFRHLGWSGLSASEMSAARLTVRQSVTAQALAP